MKSNQLRMNCVEVTVHPDLSVTYRLNLPVKPEHVHLFEDRERIINYVRNNKIRHRYVFESSDRKRVLTVMMAAQNLITGQKIKELQDRQDNLLLNLAMINDEN